MNMMMPRMMCGFGIFPLFALLVLGLVLYIVFFRQKWMTGWLALGIVSLFVVVFAAMFLMPSVRHKVEVRESQQYHQYGDVEQWHREQAQQQHEQIYEKIMEQGEDIRRRAEASGPQVPPVYTLPDDATADNRDTIMPEPLDVHGTRSEFIANVYPSAEAAARALGRLAAQLLPTVSPAGDAVNMVQVYPSQQFSDKLPGRSTVVLEALADGIKHELPGLKTLVETIEIRDPIEDTDTNAVSVELSLPQYTTHMTSPWDHNIERRDGTLRVMLKGNKGSVLARTMRFVDKPWAADYAAFDDRYPAMWLRGVSSPTATSQYQAEQEALAMVAGVVAAKLNALQSTATPGAGYAITPEMVTSYMQVHSNIDQPEQHGIIDKFSQKFERPYGDVWQVQILVRLDNKLLYRMQQIAAAQSTHNADATRATRMSWLRTGVSVIGLFALTALVYAFLNVATRGYYVWALRFLAVIMLAGGVVAVVLLT